MPRLSTILLNALTGALGGAAAWRFVLLLSFAAGSGLAEDMLRGAAAGAFIGAGLASRELLAGRLFAAALGRTLFGAAAGAAGGGAGALLGATIFSRLGAAAADLGGLHAALGVALSVALGWAILGMAVGASGGLMIRSRERALYGVIGGSLGGFLGGLLFNALSSTNPWSALAGLSLLGLSIGAFISLVEEAFVAARVSVIKGRHAGRVFPILKDRSSIGRDDRADVCLSGAEGVGVEHAVIDRRGGAYRIENAGDGTGLYVNHRKVDRARLANGDVIRIGSVLLLFSALRKTAAALVIIAAAALLPAAAQGQDQRSITITQFDLADYPEVRAYLSVLGADGKPVQGLLPRDVSVRENGLPVQDVRVQPAQSAGRREPLSLAFVIDRSGSMAGDKIARAREAVLRLAALLEPGDRASIIAFSDTVSRLVPLTDSQVRIRSAVLAVAAGGHTALYDAIAEGVTEVNKAPGRRAVVVVTDGIANRGALTLEQAVERAQTAFVSVSMIGLGDDVRRERLERISRESGGDYFFAPSADRLAFIYETIGRRIKSEYVARYTTARDDAYLRTVTVATPQGSAVRNYFQPRSSLFGAGRPVPGWAAVIPLASIAGLAILPLRRLERRYRRAHLSVVSGSSSRKEVDIAATLRIGRDERNGLGLFRDAAIAQKHAEIKEEQDGCRLVDLGSPAGTFVNGRKISASTRLSDGDVIGIGAAKLVFSSGAGAACPVCAEPLGGGARFCRRCGGKRP